MQFLEQEGDYAGYTDYDDAADSNTDYDESYDFDLDYYYYCDGDDGDGDYDDDGDEKCIDENYQ